MVALVAGVLVEHVVQPLERNLSSPWLGVDRRVLNGKRVENPLFVDPREAFDHPHMLRGGIHGRG